MLVVTLLLLAVRAHCGEPLGGNESHVSQIVLTDDNLTELQSTAAVDSTSVTLFQKHFNDSNLERRTPERPAGSPLEPAAESAGALLMGTGAESMVNHRSRRSGETEDYDSDGSDDDNCNHKVIGDIWDAIASIFRIGSPGNSTDGCSSVGNETGRIHTTASSTLEGTADEQSTSGDVTVASTIADVRTSESDYTLLPMESTNTEEESSTTERVKDEYVPTHVSTMLGEPLYSLSEMTTRTTVVLDEPSTAESLEAANETLATTVAGNEATWSYLSGKQTAWNFSSESATEGIPYDCAGAECPTSDDQAAALKIGTTAADYVTTEMLTDSTTATKSIEDKSTAAHGDGGGSLAHRNASTNSHPTEIWADTTVTEETATVGSTSLENENENETIDARTTSTRIETSSIIGGFREAGPTETPIDDKLTGKPMTPDNIATLITTTGTPADTAAENLAPDHSPATHILNAEHSTIYSTGDQWTTAESETHALTSGDATTDYASTITTAESSYIMANRITETKPQIAAEQPRESTGDAFPTTQDLIDRNTTGISTQGSSTARAAVLQFCPHPLPQDLLPGEQSADSSFPLGATFLSTHCTSDRPLLKLRCQYDKDSRATWVEETVAPCPENVELRNLSQANVSTETVSSVLTNTIDAMSAPNRTFGLAVTDITYSSVIITKVAELIEHEANKTNLSQIIVAVPAIISKIMDAPKESILASDTSSKIAMCLEQVVRATASSLEPNQTRELREENLAIQVTSDPEVLGMQVLPGNALSNATIQPVRIGDSVKMEHVGAQILLSSHVQVARKSFVIYSNDKLFQGRRMQSASEMVLSAQLSENVTHPNLISMLFQMSLNSSKSNDSGRFSVECGFWDFNDNEWSTYGCSSNGTNSKGQVACSCNHTTNFAVLTRISYMPRSEMVHYLVLAYVTRIGLSASIALLSVVLVSFLAFRKLRRTVSQQVLFNLSLSILLLDAVFLGGIDRTEDKNACVAVAMMLHLFLLASVAWMTTEAILQYLRFVRVLGTYIPRFMTKSLLSAWGLPVLVVGSLALSDYNYYNTHEKGVCWVRDEVLYYGVLLPIAVSMLFNFVMFILIMRSLLCTKKNIRSNKSESEMMRLHFRAAVAIFVATGLTWTFGFFAIDKAELTFQYLFCIFNSVQGALIAILHSLREKSLQSEWRRLLCLARSNYSLSGSSTSSFTLVSRLNSSRRERTLYS